MKRKSEILLEMVEEIFSTDEESFKELTYSPWLKPGGSLVDGSPARRLAPRLGAASRRGNAPHERITHPCGGRRA